MIARQTMDDGGDCVKYCRRRGGGGLKTKVDESLTSQISIYYSIIGEFSMIIKQVRALMDKCVK